MRPLLALVGPAQGAHFAYFTLFPIWAVEQAGMSPASVGTAFSASAALAAVSSYAGGRVSDRIGRRRTILLALGVQAGAALVIAGTPASAAAAVVSLTASASAVATRWAAQNALVADEVPDRERDGAYAAVRVVVNAGGAVGPAIAAGLVVVGWRAAFLAVAALAAAALPPATRLRPGPRRLAPTGSAPRSDAWRLFLGDRAYLLLFVAGTLGWGVYFAWEIILPVALTDGHGVAPSVWGALFALNAVAVTLFQVRVTGWTARFGRARTIGAGLVLMGGSFLLLAAGTALPLLVAFAIVFVAGEMLWAPGSQALRAELAPPTTRGAYLGALAASTFLANGLTPALGFGLREAAGETAVWLALLAAGALAAGLYALACRRDAVAMTEAPPEPAVAA